MTQTPTEQLMGRIIDSLHWKEYRFIGQGDTVFEGSLTQESEEQIATQILQALKEPVVIDGKTYTVKRVPVEFALPQNPHFIRDTGVHPTPIFRGYAQAKNDIPKFIQSQIKEL